MRLIPAIIFGSFIGTVTFAVPSEEFYILPMGQGNGQLVIYNTDQPEHKVGVLYDLGSKSLQAHPKFMRRGGWSLNFTPKPALLPGAATLTPTDIDDGPSPDRTTLLLGTAVATPDTTERKVGESQRKAIKEDLQEFINVLLGGLKHLILFLSHTDIDHINYISAETLPANLSVTTFLCGNWFGNSCNTSADQETSSTVKEVLSFLATRQNTHLEFPYYWKEIVCLESGSSEIDFNEHIRNQLSTLNKGASTDDVFDSLSRVASSHNFQPPVPTFCSGSLEALLPKPLLGMIIGNAHIMTAINNTFVWSLNLPVGDVNDYSPIISCTLPSLKLSVVFTGDAGLPVFQSVSCRHTTSTKNSFRETLSDKIDDQHLVLLMLPHHGSWLNVSGEMLRFFRPNVFGISAGDGGQHGHPSLKTIEWIQRMAWAKRLHDTFNSRFKKEQDLHIIAIRDQTEADSAKYPHMVVKMRGDFPVFLCPNIYGCIKWDREGIHTNFDNSFDIAGKKYYVAYASHEFEKEEKLNTKRNGETVQVFKTASASLQEVSLTYKQVLTEDDLPYVHLLKDLACNIFYVGVPVDVKTYFYRLIPVEPAQLGTETKRPRE